jgi:hypothetical protein
VSTRVAVPGMAAPNRRDAPPRAAQVERDAQPHARLAAARAGHAAAATAPLAAVDGGASIASALGPAAVVEVLVELFGGGADLLVLAEEEDGGWQPSHGPRVCASPRPTPPAAAPGGLVRARADACAAPPRARPRAAPRPTRSPAPRAGGRGAGARAARAAARVECRAAARGARGARGVRAQVRRHEGRRGVVGGARQDGAPALLKNLLKLKQVERTSRPCARRASGAQRPERQSRLARVMRGGSARRE